MRRIFFGIAFALVGIVACSSSPTSVDGGSDAAVVNDATTTEASLGTCRFGTSKFGDGCTFGP